MSKLYKRSLFIFRRDLRIHDNVGLLTACEQSEEVVPCFIFDRRQVGDQNSYRSKNAIQFMIESLQDLDAQLQANGGKLYLFYETAELVVEDLVHRQLIDAIFLNRDYTPFSNDRDVQIERLCNHHIAFHSYNDTLLTQPEDVQTGSGDPYKVFTPFWKNARTQHVPKPHKNRYSNYFTGKIFGQKSASIYKKILKKTNPNLHVHGGRDNALKILRGLSKFKDYNKTRDIPSIDTTHLSAHNKFGTVSIKEVYHAIKDKLGARHPLLRQLYWRDFYTHVAYHWPEVFGRAFREEFNDIAWSTSKANFKKWCDGLTGFPIVDAGMRQLNKTGFMHNRVRMIVASFLVKDLHINWLWGEKYFAQKLVDYDPAVNNGNWQWTASTGCDAQPYFRIFNPWSQQKKYDAPCAYIKKWVPELAELEPKIIHNWPKHCAEYEGYPEPMCDHDVERKKTLSIFKKARAKK